MMYLYNIVHLLLKQWPVIIIYYCTQQLLLLKESGRESMSREQAYGIVRNPEGAKRDFNTRKMVKKRYRHNIYIYTCIMRSMIIFFKS